MWTCVKECFNELRYVSDTQLRVSALEEVPHVWPRTLALAFVGPLLA